MMALDALKVDKSFFVLKRDHPIRRFAIKVADSRWLQITALAMIIANCVTLATMDACETANEAASFLDCPTPKCFWLHLADAIVLVFFTFEMLLKMLAFCAIGHKNAYLADPWNRLDALIVVCGICEYFFSVDTALNVTLIRLVRVLRPLRAIRRIPSNHL